MTYNEKHNDANGEGNQDGTSDNHSWNCGAEGPTEDAGINPLRERQIRNFLATLLLSQGTPMVLAGDEFGRTQGGNNNAYCQDNEISWLNWDLKQKGEGLIRFVQNLTGLRHEYPILRRNLFLNGEFIEELGVRDVTWINADGVEMSVEDWHNPALRTFGMLLDGRAQTTGIRQRGKEATLLIVVNGGHEVVRFTLPECEGACRWTLLIDTNIPETDQKQAFKVGARYIVTDRSLLLFALDAEAVPT